MRFHVEVRQQLVDRLEIARDHLVAVRSVGRPLEPVDPRDLVGEGELFSLKVVGDSMVDAAICDGDWVVIRRQPTCENGDIVAALLGDEATVKTFKKRDGHVWLMPHNPAYAPIPGDDADDPYNNGNKSYK